MAGERPRRQIVTIIGGGDVGFRLAQRLESVAASTCGSSSATSPRGDACGVAAAALVLHGDGTDLELLESEDIGRSDVLVSVIDNDERNLFASLLGRQLGVPKIITRVSRPGNLRLFERVGIDVALSARGAAVASIVHQIQAARDLLAVLEQGEARVLELDRVADFVARDLMTIGTPAASSSAAILRDDRHRAARRRSDRPGDRILVFSHPARRPGASRRTSRHGS